jgi:DNA-binding FadR family transcriptional regulator
VPASAALVEPRSRKPRYMQLADELRAEIAKGAFPDGFPTESILCHRFGVSRFTVREALRTLSGEGLIQRPSKEVYTRLRERSPTPTNGFSFAGPAARCGSGGSSGGPPR